MAKLIHIFILLLLFTAANAQFRYSLDQQIPVQDANGNNLTMPWAGGLNAMQYNTMDLDGDGDDDLVLFDRMVNKVITFLNVDGAYAYHPEYESLFPEQLTNWLLLRDYNCDGLKDIFTGDILGIKVYKNVTEPNEPLAWEHFLFSTGFAGSKSNVLLTKGFEFKVNLQIQFDDLPAIIDADGDGDLDIFNVRYAGHGVELHQNLSIENGWQCDSLEFVRITQKWGDFSECHCSHIALNGDDCSDGGRTKHAGGKALLALDANGDQALDLIFSEAECGQLFQMTNTGTVEAPVINSYHAFPQQNPVGLIIFPAAFYEDVDFDGVKDLLSSPNIFAKEFLETNLSESNWFYRNTGTNENPSFQFVQRNFLQDQMIDVGDNSVPAFLDYDGDGDEDMMISQNIVLSPFESTSTILLFENIGTPSEPAFRLKDDDFLSFSNAQVYNAKIQFVDVDGNNTVDLAWTGTQFNNNVTRLSFIRNNSESAFSIEGQSIQIVDFSLTSGENIRFADVNEDGLADILAGRSSGTVEYWRNTGTASEFSFSLEDGAFLGLGSDVQQQNLTCSIADLDGDGRKDFFYGDQSGRLAIISDFKSAEPVTVTNLVYNTLADQYQSPNLGGRIFPVAVDLYHSAKPAIVVGNLLGGIHILRNENQSSLFPNPVVKNDLLDIEVDEPSTLFIYSATGRLVNEPLSIAADDVRSYDVSDLAAGFYIFKFISRSKTITRKVVIR